MSKAFFLTRQTAELMDGFVRRLGDDSSLYLFYGDAGVGKTRTLEELVATRLGEFKVHWIDLQAGDTEDGAPIDFSARIESVFAEAQPGDIIVADHFEMGLKKPRHQLFVSWSKDGADKGLNLIIAGRTEYFKELRQLAKHYQLQVKSFQQMPFSADEAADFLSFYLFPDRPTGKLSIPRLLRNQLRKAQGKVGRIIEIAERAGDQITTANTDERGPVRQGSQIIVGVLTAVVVVVSVGWYLFGSQFGEDDLQVAAAGSVARQFDLREVSMTSEAVTTADVEADTAEEDRVAIESQAPQTGSATPAAAADESATADDIGAVDSSTVQPRDSVIVEAALAAPGPETGTGPEAAIEPEAEPEVEIGTGIETAIESEAGVEPEAAVEPKPVSEPEPEPEPEITTAAADAKTSTPPSAQDRLSRDLQSSLDWINNRDSKIGTLQIMLLSLDRFDLSNYYKYLDRLANNAIDISMIRIFTTRTGDRDSYSVVYGEYDSWKAANESRNRVPPVLKENSPIPRSVGGLMEEIERLQARN